MFQQNNRNTTCANSGCFVPFSEKINVVTTRGGKSTRDPQCPNHVEKAARPQVEEEESTKHDVRLLFQPVQRGVPGGRVSGWGSQTKSLIVT